MAPQPHQVTPLPFEIVNVPEQKLFNGVPFPLVVQPSSSSTTLAEAVRAHKGWVEGRLEEGGAVLFRGFDVPTASDFNEVVESFGYEAFPFAGLFAPRTHIVGSVHTTNDSPPHLCVPFHNEMAYLENYPAKAFFHCEVEPGSQGETPIVLGHVVYERLKQNHSDFLRHVEEHGVVYRRLLPNETDPSSPVGQGWKATFSTDDKAIAEQKAAAVGLKLEWLENGPTLATRPLPAVKIDTSRTGEERRIWHNSLMAALLSGGNTKYKLQNRVTTGDGAPIPPEMVEECRVILEEECVAVPWRRGDVLMLDNCTVQHSRRPFTPPRKVLAAFTK